MRNPRLPHVAALAKKTGRVVAFFVALSSSVVGSFASNSDQTHSESLSGYYLAARTALIEQDFKNAGRYFSKALALDPDNFYLQDRAFTMYLADGQIDKCLELGKKLLESDPEHFLAGFVQAVHDVHARQYNAVIGMEDEVSTNPLARMTFALLKAWAYAGNGNVDAGVKVLQELKGPTWFELFTDYNIALMLEHAGESEKALPHYAKAYEADPGALRSMSAYVKALAANGQQKKSLEILDKFEKHVPDHPSIISLRAHIVSGAMQKPMVGSIDAGVSEALYGLGAAISRDGEELSAAFLQLSVYLEPHFDEANIALAALYEQMGNYERSIDYLSKVSPSSPMKRDAEIQEALHLNVIDELEKSKSKLEALIKEKPDDVEAYTSLGNVLRSHSKFAEAEAAYSEGLKLVAEQKEQNWVLLYFRGITRERQDKWDLAENDFRNALEIQPDQPMVLNYLGYSLVDRGMRFDEALKMIKKAVRLRPTDGYIVDSLGWVYYRLGRYDEAVKELERAVALRPHDPLINEHLGDAYWKLGRRLDAGFKWNHARDLDPEPEDLKRILGKIKNGLSADTTQESAAVGD
ncbi:tetratricopeptide repeat protein [Polycladidibacter stylochi]|uniref:tetratricopeptide repeat protein n=1 Tax=Polycladidibacter stylochi TaxID=1807766 RepID=UPI0008360B5D|nr:tetratricopeptide repeat protein [Pseudovibrio stylochi]